MMPTTEHTINDAVAAILRTTRHVWRHSKIVLSENTGMLKGGNRQPDILVVEPNVSPVVVETEVLPAVNPSPPGHRRTVTRNQISYQ